MSEDVLAYARRLARDAEVWQRVASGGPAAADAEWPRVLEAIRSLNQQLKEIYPLAINENEAQVFLASALEGLAFRRAPGQVLVDGYTMPPDRSQWRLLTTTLFGIDVTSADPASPWQWRGTDGRLRTSEELAAESISGLLMRDRTHRGIPERAT